MGKNIYMGKRWPLRVQFDFFESFADMLKNGFSLKQCIFNLKILYPALASSLTNVYQQLQQGKSFSKRFRLYLNLNVYYQLVIVEEHGELELSVHELGKVLRQKLAQKEKLIDVLVYPLILFCLLIAIIVVFWI